MEQRRITDQIVESYQEYLCREEKSRGTIEKYVRDIRSFAAWLSGQEVTKELTVRWKERLLEAGYGPGTANSMLSAINGLFSFLDWQDCRVKFFKLQRRLFRDESKDLEQNEYRRLVETAYGSGKERLGLVIETICGTGIRVSELEYITVEAAKAGRAEVALKGKIRVIMLGKQLRRKLIAFAKKKKIISGQIFLTRNGTGLSRRQIWAEMKRLCAAAGVEASKVFPHNLRHLFAKTFYKAHGDIVKLADVLGHTSIDTTRIYLLTTGAEHMRQLDCLGLVS